MNREIFEGIALILFLLVQMFVVGIFFVIRYHFRNFSAPGDTRAKGIVRWFGAGMTLSIAVAGMLLIQIFY